VLVSVIGNLGSAVAPDHTVLLVSRFVAGLAVATFFAVAIATAVALGPADRAGSAVAQVALGMTLGLVLGTPLGTLLGQLAGWRTTFAAVAALSLVALAMVLASVPDAAPAASGRAFGELRVLAGRDLQLAVAMTALGSVGVVMVFSYTAPLLVGVAGIDRAAVPALLLVHGAGAVLGTLVGGRLADRALLPSLIIVLAVLVGVLALFWAVGTSPVPATILTFAVGALAFAVIPGMQTRVLATAGSAPTLAVAVNAAGYQLAAAAAGWLGGRVIDAAGLRSMYPAAALLTAAGLAVAIGSLRRDRRIRADAGGRP
jgi:DHA1 family inner membrane transport protein